MKRLIQLAFFFFLVLSFFKLQGQSIEFTLKYNEAADQYEVYALPDASNPSYFVGGGSQISLVLPASIPNTPLVITTVNGGLWTDNSRVFAPTADPAHDFHGIASSGSFVSFTAGQELLLYTFKLTPSGCLEGPRIFESAIDPDSNAPGMNGGDFLNFFPDLFTFVDGYNGNYNNAGILCNTPPIITYAPDTTYQELDTTIVIDVVTNDNSSMEADSTLTYSLLGIDETLFEIDSITGQITFINSPDFENPLDDGMDNVYNIEVMVCDDADPILCDTQAVAISVINNFSDDGIRLLCVNPTTDQVIIKNFGPNTRDISTLRLCSKFSYTNSDIATDMNIINGSLTLAPGDSVVLDGFSLDDVAADLGLYTPNGAFTDTIAMLDFTQWGSGGNGRESVAVTKGIWGAGDFMVYGPDYCYDGDGLTENGLMFWEQVDPPLAIIDRAVTGENVTVIIDVQQNDLNFGPDSLVTSVIGISTQGVSPTVLNGDSISYAPPTNFTGVDTITYQICLAQNPTVCDTTIILVNVSPDSDMDGISDIVDIDDDNDGIPDLEECPFVEFTFNLNVAKSDSTALVYEAMVHGQVEQVVITASTNPQSNLDANNQVSPTGVILSTSLSEPIAMKDDSIFESALTFTPSLPLQSIRLEDLSDMDRRLGDFPTDAFGFSADGFWTVVTGDFASYDASTGMLITNNPNGDATATLGDTDNSAHEMVQKGVQSPILVRGTIGETNNGEVIFTTYSPFTSIDLIVEDLSLNGLRELIDNRSIVATLTVGIPLCDVDNDNIPNYLDLDSDGDGCADAMEAGHGLPMQGDSTIAGDYGANGLADAVETNIDSDTLNYTFWGTANNPEFSDSLTSSGCNEAPVIVYAPDTTYNEGNTTVVIDVIATDDMNSEIDSTLRYSLVGIDNALFIIDSLTGEINFVTPPLIDNPMDDGIDNIYNIEVIVCDQGRMILCDTQAVAITIVKDNDGDGIPDIIDLDDDNDGILDWDECEGVDATFTYNNSLSDNTKLVYTATIDGQLETVTLTASTNPQSLLNPAGMVESNGTTLTPNGGNGLVNLRDDATMEAALTFTSSIPIIYIKFIDLDDMDRKLGDLPSDAFGFNTTGYWEIIEGDLAAYDPATGALVVNNPNGDATPLLSDVGDSGFEMLNKNTLSGILTRGTVGETNNAKANFIASAPFTTTDMLSEDLSLNGNRELVTSNFILQFLTIGIPDCDPDEDGIPNYFDLDSDGDGCPDALEAGHGIAMQVDSTIAGPYGNNGVADTLETNDSRSALANYTLTETNTGTYDFVDASVTTACNEICGNGMDDDGDGKTDCEDTDCMPIQLAALDTLTSTTYCLNLPYADVALYTILLNGNTYTPSAPGCDFDQTQGYSTANFTINSPPFAVTWMYNGNPESTTVTSVAELVAWMNIIDVDADWRSDVLPSAIAYTQRNNPDTYGALTFPTNAGTVTTNINSVTVPFGTAIEVITLDSHQIIIMNNASSCSDTLNLIYLNEPPLITYAPDTTFVENDTSLVVDIRSIDDTSSEADSTLKYSFLTAGLDEALFTIDSITGQIRFITPPDFENPQDDNGDNVYDVTVLVCDAQNLCDPEFMSITVVNNYNDDGIRLLCVNPNTNQITIKNFGSNTIDISNHRLCSKFSYTNSGLASDMNIINGALVLTPGDSVTLDGFSIDELGADLGLYAPTGGFADTLALLDFTQWKSAGNGRESVAVAKGIWGTGDFRTDFPTYCYIGDGKENGVNFWDGNEAPIASNDSIEIIESIATINIDVQVNDSDPDGNPLTTTIIGTSTQGISPTVANGNSINYIPPTDFSGIDTITYQICDNGTPQLCDTAIIFIIIQADTDGDSIPDEIDLDDDNDGILDVDELGIKYLTCTTAPTNPNGGEIRRQYWSANAGTTTINATNWANTINTGPDPMNPINGPFWGAVDGDYAALNSFNGPSTTDATIAVPANSIIGGITTAGEAYIVDLFVSLPSRACFSDLVGSPVNEIMLRAGGRVGNASHSHWYTPTANPNAAQEFSRMTKPHNTGTLTYSITDIVDGGGIFNNGQYYTGPTSNPAEENGNLIITISDVATPHFLRGYVVDPAANGSLTYEYSTDGGTNWSVIPNTWFSANATDQATAIASESLETWICEDGNCTSNLNNTETEANLIANGAIPCPIDIDTDMDGIPNRLDLDSDGDGCMDAIEAGHNIAVQIDSTIAGPYGANGLATSVENNDTDTATVNYTITGVVGMYEFLDSTLQSGCNSPPIAINDSLNIAENQNIIIPVQLNDSDLDGDDLTTTIIGTSTAGVNPTVLNGDSLDYTPPTDFTGIDTITYQICDNGTPQICDTAMVFITVQTDNDGDGISDENDLDDDNDGIPDTDEFGTGCEKVIFFEGFEGGYGQELPAGMTVTGQDLALFNMPNGTGGQLGSPLDNGLNDFCADGEEQCEATLVNYPFNFSCLPFNPNGGAGNVSMTGNSGFFFNGCRDNNVANVDADNDGRLGEIICFNNFEIESATDYKFSYDFVNIFPGDAQDPTYTIFVDLYDSNGNFISTNTNQVNNLTVGTILHAEILVSVEQAGNYNICFRTDQGNNGIDVVLDNITLCTADSDGDGIINIYDLDSDGDGCPDANEAGHGQLVQADSTIAGPYGENGLAASVENSDSDTATINYTINETNTGTGDFVNSSVKNGCDQITTLTLKVMLQGALLGSTDGLMRDDLRNQNFIPLNQPYNQERLISERFTHIGGGTETTTALILNANLGTADAIVDWVFVELRDPADSTTVFQTMAALVQKDGDVVDATTGAPIILMNPPLSFFVAVKHRNHLGAMTKNRVMTVNDTATIDFTTMALSEFYTKPGYDDLAVTTLSGKRALWAGNANIDFKSKYDGAANDRIIIGNDVITHISNSMTTLNYANTLGYYQGDINLDGRTKYDGASNDRIILQNIILTYPLNLNDLQINNYNNMIEQIPDN